MDRFAYKDGYFYGNATLPPQQQPSDAWRLFREVTYDLHELLSIVSISTSDPDTPEVNITFGEREMTEAERLRDEKVARFVTKFDDTFGRCFMMYIEPEVARLGIVNIVATAKLGVYIYIHHPGQYTDVDSKTKVSLKKEENAQALINNFIICV